MPAQLSLENMSAQKNLIKSYPTVIAGIILAQVFTVPFAVMLIFFGDQWISLFLDPDLTGNMATIVLVKSAIMLAFIMLFIDTFWLILIESLHGLLDTTFPAISALIAYWLIAGPIAFWATFNSSDPFTWIWISLLIAACLLTILVGYRLNQKVRQLSNIESMQPTT